MLGSYIAGFAVIVMVMLPGLILALAGMGTGDAADKGKHIIGFVSLAFNLVAMLGFLGFLYVKPTYLNLHMLHALPFLTRSVFNPWILHSFTMVVLLIAGVLHWIFRKPLRGEHGFSIVTIVVLLVSICLWALGSTFHYGLAGKLFVGGRLSTAMFVPLHAAIVFFLFFGALTGLYVRHIRKRRFLWLLSIILLCCSLVAYHAFAWYLPTFPLGS